MAAVIRDNISNSVDIMEGEYSLKKTRHFVALGSEMRLLATKIGSLERGVWRVDTDAFYEFIEKLKPMSPSNISSSFFIPISDAVTLLPSLSIYDSLLQRTAAKQILVPDVSIRDGVLIAHGGRGREARRKLYEQIMASAKTLGRKYHYDENHAEQVSKMSLCLFEALSKEHGLTEKMSMLLNVAATLHDVGTFVNQSAHHKHSFYIIQNSEIFGLNTHDLDVVAHTARYHRKGLPSKNHVEFNALSSKTRINVMKLASLLRIADSLDAGHAGRVEIIKIAIKDNVLYIHLTGAVNLSLESISFIKKQDLFEEVYGMKVRLINGSQLL